MPALLREHIASIMGTVLPHNDTGDAEDKEVVIRVFEAGPLKEHLGAPALVATLLQALAAH